MNQGLSAGPGVLDAQAEANYSAACRQTPDNDLQRPAEHTAPVVDVIDGHFDAATPVVARRRAGAGNRIRKRRDESSDEQPLGIKKEIWWGI